MDGRAVENFRISSVVMSSSIRKLNYRDYICFPDDGQRHELIDGDHYMNPAPSTYHQAVSRRIQFQLYQQIEQPGLGSVIDAPVDVQLSEFDIVQPDLVIVLQANRIITPSKVKGVPNHIIEILSPSTERNDCELKYRLYERVGVPEYWIVDPLEHEVQQYVISAGRYVQREHGEVIMLSYLELVSVDLSAVW